MAITVEIKSHALLGGGPFVYCTYKIDIKYNNEVWSVYRRYSEFCKLYDYAKHEIGNNFINLNIPILPNSNGGSFYGTLQETIYERIPLLNNFIKKLVSLDPNRLLNCVANFIDITNKGISGVSIEKGANNILIESFVQCKHHFVAIWMTHLIVVTKGFIYYYLYFIFFILYKYYNYYIIN